MCWIAESPHKNIRNNTCASVWSGKWRRDTNVGKMNSCTQWICGKHWLHLSWLPKRFKNIFITVGESEIAEICKCEEIKHEVSHKNKSHSYGSASYHYQSPCREDRISCGKLWTSCLPGSLLLARHDQSMPEAFRDFISQSCFLEIRTRSRAAIQLSIHLQYILSLEKWVKAVKEVLLANMCADIYTHIYDI